jgi:hypothetical protein
MFQGLMKKMMTRRLKSELDGLLAVIRLPALNAAQKVPRFFLQTPVI